MPYARMYCQRCGKMKEIKTQTTSHGAICFDCNEAAFMEAEFPNYADD